MYFDCWHQTNMTIYEPQFTAYAISCLPVSPDDQSGRYTRFESYQGSVHTIDLGVSIVQVTTGLFALSRC